MLIGDSLVLIFFFFSSRRRHTRFDCDWSSDVCSSDLFSWGKRRRRLRSGFFHRARKRRGSARFSAWIFWVPGKDRKSTCLNSSHSQISYAVFCLKKKKRCLQSTSRGITLIFVLVRWWT